MRFQSGPAATEAVRLLEAEGNAVTPTAILDRAKLLMDRDRVLYHGDDRDGRLYCAGCLWCET